MTNVEWIPGFRSQKYTVYFSQVLKLNESWCMFNPNACQIQSVYQSIISLSLSFLTRAWNLNEHLFKEWFSFVVRYISSFFFFSFLMKFFFWIKWLEHTIFVVVGKLRIRNKCSKSTRYFIQLPDLMDLPTYSYQQPDTIKNAIYHDILTTKHQSIWLFLLSNIFTNKLNKKRCLNYILFMLANDFCDMKNSDSESI